jgi:alkylated DNA nucleotide flippase Atl1
VASIDFARAAAFIAAVPKGRWTTYGDAARPGGVPAHHGGQAIGEWRRREGHIVRNVYRVLTVDGYVSDGFRPAGPGVPADQERVRDLLRKEGVTISARGRASKRQRFHYDDWH